MSKKTHNPKFKNSEVEKIPLAEYYEKLPGATRIVMARSPKEDFLKELSIITGRTPDTVRSWCLGYNTPSKKIRRKIANHMKIDEHNLFPNIK